MPCIIYTPIENHPDHTRPLRLSWQRMVQNMADARVTNINPKCFVFAQIVVLFSSLADGLNAAWYLNSKGRQQLTLTIFLLLLIVPPKRPRKWYSNWTNWRSRQYESEKKKKKRKNCCMEWPTHCAAKIKSCACLKIQLGIQRFSHFRLGLNSRSLCKPGEPAGKGEAFIRKLFNWTSTGYFSARVSGKSLK